MNQANLIELKSNLKNLKLSAMVSELEVNLRQATDTGVGYDEFLINLTNLEIESRSASRLKRRIREAFNHCLDWTDEYRQGNYRSTASRQAGHSTV